MLDATSSLVIITVCVAVAVFPLASVAVQVTVVVPTGKVAGASFVRLAIEQLSAVAGVPNTTPVPEQAVIVAKAALETVALTEAGLKNANN